MSTENYSGEEARAAAAGAESEEQPVQFMTLATLREIVAEKIREIEEGRKYASVEFADDFEDPRVVATKAAIRDARRPDRLFEPGGYVLPTEMQPGAEYQISAY